MSTNTANQTALETSEAPEVTSEIPVVIESAQPAEEASVVEAAEAAAAPEIVPAPANPEAASAETTADADAADGEDAEMDFAQILAGYEESHKSEIIENELVKGRVVKITDQVVVIDVGYKSEGIVPIAEFREGDRIIVQP
ncbi:MAG: hypothetical protein AAB401_24745, partial [Acidobacteriota bacterium]